MLSYFRQHKPVISYFLFAFSVLVTCAATAQVKQMVQIKTFDQQLKPYKNLELVLNEKNKVTTDAKGTAFIELNESELPVRSVEIKTDGLETASWNFSKGAVEIIVRKKNYKLVTVTIVDSQRQPIARMDVVFSGTRKITLRTNAEGNVYIPLNLDERITAPDQFSIAGYQAGKLTADNGMYTLSVERIRVPAAEEPKQSKGAITSSRKSYDREVANIDTVQSLTSFYQLVRNIAMDELNRTQKAHVDAKFKTLVKEMQASRPVQPPVARVVTKESVTVPADTRKLMQDLEEERRQLDIQRTEDKLAQSKAARLQEQEEILIAGTSLVMVASLFILLISSRRKMQRHKAELDVANNQIAQLYEDFEGRVADRTTSLNDVNTEQELLLRGALADLQKPIASIYDLGNGNERIPARELIEKAVGSAVVMDNLVKNLAVISELNQPKHLSEIHVCRVLQKMRAKFELQMEENNIQSTWVCDDSIRFKAYPVFFEAMLNKLVENALFFGQLREKTEGQRTTIKISITSTNKELIIIVEDNGVGIMEDLRPHIFKMFFKSEKSMGSGLGLFIVSRSVWHMQGNIKLDTKPDHYTRFTIRLPERG